MTDQTTTPAFGPDEVLPPLEEVPDGIMLADAEGIVRYANKAAAELLLTELGSMVGQSFGIPLTGGAHPEIEVREADGSSRVLELRAKQVSLRDEDHWVITIRDETARVENAQRLSDELDSRDIALAATSHELRSAVAAMSMVIDTLKASWDQLAPSNRENLLDILERNVRRMSNSLDRFLDAARLGDEIFRPSPAVTRVLDAVLESVVSVGNDATHVEIDVPQDCQANIDPFHLVTILSNLVGNSLKHGGRPVVVTAHTSDHTATISVIDSGPGVAPDVADRLFDRFTRGRKSDAIDGFGLGLWIARSLARAYGGELTYEDNQPAGARFVCVLPTGAPQ